MPLITQNVDKSAIAAAFSRAATRYDAAAQLQRKSGEDLLDIARCLMNNDTNHDYGRSVLDAGCGTGYFSRYWRNLGKEVIALDLSEAMLHQAKHQQSADIYLLGDIEHIPLLNKKIDICFSNLVMQWCHSLATALAELYRVTQPGGIIIFSTLAEGSLDELGRAWQQVDGHRHSNDFPSVAQIQAVCANYHHHLSCCLHQFFFPDVFMLMRSLQGIGATHLHHGRKKGLTGRQKLNALQAAYPVNRRGYPLSYQLVYGVIYRV